MHRRKLSTIYSTGPGGMHCHCCGCQMDPAKAKPLESRILRRRNKQYLRTAVLKDIETIDQYK